LCLNEFYSLHFEITLVRLIILFSFLLLLIGKSLIFELSFGCIIHILNKKILLGEEDIISRYYTHSNFIHLFISFLSLNKNFET